MEPSASRLISLRCPVDVADAFERAARADDTTVSAQLRRLMRLYLRTREDGAANAAPVAQPIDTGSNERLQR
jgi:hypothetical protein